MDDESFKNNGQRLESAEGLTDTVLCTCAYFGIICNAIIFILRELCRTAHYTLTYKFSCTQYPSPLHWCDSGFTLQILPTRHSVSGRVRNYLVWLLIYEFGPRVL